MPLHPPTEFFASVPFLDWTVIVLYLLGMMGVGLYYSRRTLNTDDYLLGNRRMKPAAVGLSLFASLLSSISYIGYTGEMIRYGPMYLVGIAAFPAVLLLVGWFMIPFFMRLNVTSAYEILESRFDVRIRLLGSFFFLSLRLLWMAVIIFATTDKVLAPMLGLGSSWTPVICAVLGLITILYTSLGGLRAVIVTDVIQSAILFGGAILTLILITQHFGKVQAWWPREWPDHWPKMVWGYDPAARMTFVGVVISVFFWHLCTAGSDQIAVQRYLATENVSAARKVFAINLAATTTAMILLGIVGLALIAFFNANPGMLAPGQSLTENADKLFPRYITEILPPGISGLVFAGLLAAAMSSLSSGTNSAAAVVTVDFINRFRNRALNQKARLRLVRLVSIVTGLIVVGLSLLVGMVHGNLFEVSNKVVNLFVAPLFVLFFLAMFVRLTTTTGAWCGAIASVTVAVLIAFWKEMTGNPGISFLWIMPASFFTGILTASAVSLLLAPRRPGKS